MTSKITPNITSKNSAKLSLYLSLLALRSRTELWLHAANCALLTANPNPLTANYSRSVPGRTPLGFNYARPAPGRTPLGFNYARSAPSRILLTANRAPLNICCAVLAACCVLAVRPAVADETQKPVLKPAAEAQKPGASVPKAANQSQVSVTKTRKPTNLTQKPAAETQKPSRKVPNVANQSPKPVAEAPKPGLAVQKPSPQSATPAAEPQKAAAESEGQAGLTKSPASQTLKPVLAPEKFFGQAKLGYMAAKACPEICDKLFCYCGCDLTDDHSTLLDCFTTDHGVDCHICQQEAFIALKMKREGKPLGEIQKAVDIAFEKQYPFDEISPALQKYIDNREWKDTRPKSKSADTSGGDKASAAEARKGMSGDSVKTSQTGTGQSSGTTAKASPTGKKSSCCAGKKQSQIKPK